MDPSLIKVFPVHAALDDGGCNAIRAASSLLLQTATWQSMAEEKVVRTGGSPKKVYSLSTKLLGFQKLSKVDENRTQLHKDPWIASIAREETPLMDPAA